MVQANHDFYSLEEAAKLHDCKVTDFLKWGAAGKIKLYVWFKGPLYELCRVRGKVRKKSLTEAVAIPSDDIMDVWKNQTSYQFYYTTRTIQITTSSGEAGRIDLTFILGDLFVMTDELKAFAPQGIAQKSHLLDLQKRLTEDDYVIQTSTEISPEKKGGKPKGPLAEAIERAYQHFLANGNKEILKPKRINDFFKSFKELHEKGNGEIQEYLSERIENVKISVAGNTITTSEQVLKIGQGRETTIKKQCYRQNAVSKILTKLRVKYSLNP